PARLLDPVAIAVVRVGVVAVQGACHRRHALFRIPSITLRARTGVQRVPRRVVDAVAVAVEENYPLSSMNLVSPDVRT
ncbi:MAG TPA: hypothetical protein VMW54_06125, partial [Terriglobia bacterium]|nr:hypothetical protein [Terriglobia bacterium]